MSVPSSADAWAALLAEGVRICMERSRRLGLAEEAHLRSVAYEAAAAEMEKTKPACHPTMSGPSDDDEWDDGCTACEFWWSEYLEQTSHSFQCAHLARLIWAHVHGVTENWPWDDRFHPYDHAHDGTQDEEEGWALVFGAEPMPDWMTLPEWEDPVIRRPPGV